MGAGHVDGIELVCTVVNQGKTRYASYTGGLFNHPRVSVICDDGRSFLHGTSRLYDVIQIHSNHTVSSIANGSGGADPVYLQTVEAYQEFFRHLSPNGILQINYFVYPRMITTAAKAWAALYPNDDFRAHLVITDGLGPTEPTFLVKRSPWTTDEIGQIRRFLGPEIPDSITYRLLYALGQPEAATVPADLFQVPLPREVAARVPYFIDPPTDDQPFFRDFHKNGRKLQADSAGYVPPSAAALINSTLQGRFPMERIHLYLLGGMSLVMSAIALLIPAFGPAGRTIATRTAAPALLYFGALGAGFIIVELALLYKFVLIVGHPIYAMATVLFTLLVGAGIGSAVLGRLSQRARPGWVVLLAAALIVAAVPLAFPMIRDAVLGSSQVVRILVVALAVLPVGFVLGMPFPLGISLLSERRPALIPWAWGVNAIMTVVGSLAAVLIALRFGFSASLVSAAALYLLAGGCYQWLARTAPAREPSAESELLVQLDKAGAVERADVGLGSSGNVAANR